MLGRLTVALVLALTAVWVGCGEDPVPPEERPVAAACEDDVQCASKVCVGGGQCPDGSGYRAFCAGASCKDGSCPIGDKCISLDREDAAPLKVCIPTTICN